jgi:hypothetical protein
MACMAYMYVCMYVCILYMVCMYVCMYGMYGMYVYMYVWYVCMYAYVWYVCIYVSICIYVGVMARERVQNSKL